jgi:hypothetical protein
MEYLLGVIVSLVVQGGKKIMKTTKIGTYVYLLSMSMLAGAAYYYTSQSDFWPALVQIGTAAAAFHNLVIRRFEQ